MMMHAFLEEEESEDHDHPHPDSEYASVKRLINDPFYTTRTARLRGRFWPTDIEAVQWSALPLPADDATSKRRTATSSAGENKGVETDRAEAERQFLRVLDRGLDLLVEADGDSVSVATGPESAGDGKDNICVLGPLDRTYSRNSLRPLLHWAAERNRRRRTRVTVITPQHQVEELEADLSGQRNHEEAEGGTSVLYEDDFSAARINVELLRLVSQEQLFAVDFGAKRRLSSQNANDEKTAPPVTVTDTLGRPLLPCRVISLHAGSHGFSRHLYQVLSGGSQREKNIMTLNGFECERGPNHGQCKLLISQFRQSHCGTGLRREKEWTLLEGGNGVGETYLNNNDNMDFTSSNTTGFLVNPDCMHLHDVTESVVMPVRNTCVCVSRVPFFTDAEEHLSFLLEEQCEDFRANPLARFSSLSLMERWQRRKQLERVEGFDSEAGVVFRGEEEAAGADRSGAGELEAASAGVVEELGPRRVAGLTRAEFLDSHGYPADLFDEAARQREIFVGYSQWRQDWFLHRNFFRFSPSGGRNGFYLDIGASQPTLLSNTAVFESCLGWQGVCVEPNLSRMPALLLSRTCLIVPHCVAEKERVLTLHTDHAGAGEGMATAETDDQRSAAIPDERFDAEEVIDSLCFRLEKLLDQIAVGGASELPVKSGLSSDVVHPGASLLTVDLISLDVEGQEVAILRRFPFNKFYVRVFLVEADHESALQLDLLFLAGGYSKVALLGKDAVYLHNRFIAELAAWKKASGALKMPRGEDGREDQYIEDDVLALEYPEDIAVHPYYEKFSDFQKRFLEPGFGERR